MAIKIDLVDGADHELDASSGNRVERATRIGLVYGLSAGTTADAALIYARTIVEAAYPVGTAYGAGSLATVTGYRVEGIGEDDAVRVRIYYSTQVGAGGGGGGGVVWQVERDADEEIVGTQLSPSTGRPLEVLWTNPANAAQNITDIVTVPLSRSVRRIVLSGIMTDAQADAYEVEQGKVNATTWRGLPKGYWKFRRLNTTTVPGSGFHRARVELITKITESWAEYGLLRGPDGKYVKVTPADIATLRSDYVFGAVYVNGAVRVGGNPVTDFDALFVL